MSVGDHEALYDAALVELARRTNLTTDEWDRLITRDVRGHDATVSFGDDPVVIGGED